MGRIVREKQRQLESLTKVNKTTFEELDKFGYFDSSNSDGFESKEPNLSGS